MASNTAYGPAFALITVGGLLAYSGFKGKSVTQILAGDIGASLNPAGSRAASASGGGDAPAGGSIASISGGAAGIVDSAAAIVMQAGGGSLSVVSTERPGDTTTSGNLSDHSENNANRAARDVAKNGVDAITGPPSPELDRGAAALGKAFGRNYGDGARRIVDTFTFKGYRVQIIWRTPEYGGHMGHIHIGARKL